MQNGCTVIGMKAVAVKTVTSCHYNKPVQAVAGNKHVPLKDVRTGNGSMVIGVHAQANQLLPLNVTRQDTAAVPVGGFIIMLRVQMPIRGHGRARKRVTIVQRLLRISRAVRAIPIHPLRLAAILLVTVEHIGMIIVQNLVMPLVDALNRTKVGQEK